MSQAFLIKFFKKKLKENGGNEVVISKEEIISELERHYKEKREVLNVRANVYLKKLEKWGFLKRIWGGRKRRKIIRVKVFSGREE